MHRPVLSEVTPERQLLSAAARHYPGRPPRPSLPPFTFRPGRSDERVLRRSAGPGKFAPSSAPRTRSAAAPRRPERRSARVVGGLRGAAAAAPGAGRCGAAAPEAPKPRGRSPVADGSAAGGLAPRWGGSSASKGERRTGERETRGGTAHEAAPARRPVLTFAELEPRTRRAAASRPGGDAPRPPPPRPAGPGRAEAGEPPAVPGGRRPPRAPREAADGPLPPAPLPAARPGPLTVLLVQHHRPGRRGRPPPLRLAGELRGGSGPGCGARAAGAAPGRALGAAREAGRRGSAASLGAGPAGLGARLGAERCGPAPSSRNPRCQKSPRCGRRLRLATSPRFAAAAARAFPASKVLFSRFHSKSKIIFKGGGGGGGAGGRKAANLSRQAEALAACLPPARSLSQFMCSALSPAAE